MDVFFLLARVLFVAAFVYVVVEPLTRPYRGGGLLRRRGPAAELDPVLPLLPLAVAGAVMVALGLLADLGAMLIAIFLIAISVLVYPFWKLGTGVRRERQGAQFWINVAFLLGAVFIFYIYVEFGKKVGLSLTDPLF
jgi:putative oxidoreductase